LDLSELQTTDSAAIVTALLGCLQKHGFTHDDVLRKRLICFASDDASVMVGKTSGVAQAIAVFLKHARGIVQTTD